MRKSLILVVLVGLALMVALPAATAAAPAPHHLRASFTSVSTVPGPPLGCPTGFDEGWSIGSSGSGTLVSPVYSGPVLVNELHCSRWLAFDPTRPGSFVGDVAGGRLTLTAAGDPASRLVLAFDGVFQLTGDPTGPFSFFSRITLRVTIVDGTGVFAGASGSGHLAVTGDAVMDAELVGSFVTG